MREMHEMRTEKVLPYVWYSMVYAWYGTGYSMVYAWYGTGYSMVYGRTIVC